MSQGFGSWNEDRKAQEGGDVEAGWFDTEAFIPTSFPTFNTEAISWDSMKSSMESQMPRTILGMGYQQRFQVFCGLLGLSALFFALAFFIGLPAMALRPQKFAISFTMGSLTFMGSFGILKGPQEHLQSMFARDRMAFSALYVGSMMATLYLTFTHGGISGYMLVLSASAVQLVCLLWYLISFLPGGTAGLKYVFAVLGHLLKPVIVACTKFQAVCCARCLAYFARSSTGG